MNTMQQPENKKHNTMKLGYPPVGTLRNLGQFLKRQLAYQKAPIKSLN
jgi:hypothetical protein